MKHAKQNKLSWYFINNKNVSINVSYPCFEFLANILRTTLTIKRTELILCFYFVGGWRNEKRGKNLKKKIIQAYKAWGANILFFTQFIFTYSENCYQTADFSRPTKLENLKILCLQLKISIIHHSENADMKDVNKMAQKNIPVVQHFRLLQRWPHTKLKSPVLTVRITMNLNNQNANILETTFFTKSFSQPEDTSQGYQCSRSRILEVNWGHYHFIPHTFQPLFNNNFML